MQSDDQLNTVDVLDPAQLKRIESLHKGFLYQHLYGVGCLFLAQAAGVKEVLVELDEDIEISTDAGRIYIQVKTRSQPLMPGDVAGALERFEQIRQSHGPEGRSGNPEFVIVANQPLGRTLQAEVDEKTTPSDLTYLYPGSKAPRPEYLPPAWVTLEEAAQWCVDPYLEGVEDWQKQELHGQTLLIGSIISESRRVAFRSQVGAVGRNEQCPCGSGRKFKKCHGT